MITMTNITYRRNAARRAAFLGMMKKSSEGIPTLGDILTWDLQGIQVRHPDLCRALEEHNLGYYLPPPPGEVNTLERAINDWLDDRQRSSQGLFHSNLVSIGKAGSDGSKRSTYLLRPLTPEKNANVSAGFAVVLEESDSQDLEVCYATQLRVAVRPDGTLLVAESPRGRLDSEGARPDLAAELRPYWSYYDQVHTSEALAALVCKIVKGMDATPIRSCGGAYYVPAFWQRGVTCLESLALNLRRLSISSAQQGVDENPLHVLGIVDSQRARASLTYDVYHRLEADIAELSSDLAALIDSSERKVRVQTLRNQLIKYKEVRLKIEMFAELLNLQKELLLKNLATLQDQIKETLEQIEIQPLLDGFCDY